MNFPSTLANQQSRCTRWYLLCFQHGSNRWMLPFLASTTMNQHMLKSVMLFISLWQLLVLTQFSWGLLRIRCVAGQLFLCTLWAHPCNEYSHGVRGNPKTQFSLTSRIVLGTLNLLLINYVLHGCCTNVSLHGHSQSLSTLLYLFSFNFIRNSLYVCNLLCVTTGKIKMMQSSSFSVRMVKHII